MKIMLTEEYRKRISKEITDCEIRLEKENCISSDLRNYDRVKELTRHIMKLNKHLADGFVITGAN